MVRLWLVLLLITMTAPQGLAQQNAAPPRTRASDSLRVIPVAPPSPPIETLRWRIDLSLDRVPLEDVIQDLSDRIRIPIIIHESSLTELGLTGKEPLSGMLRNISVASALQMLLWHIDPGGQQRLTYMVEEDTVRVVSNRFARQLPSTRLYRMQMELNLPKFLRVIQRIGGKGTWEPYGGPSTVRALPGTLVVRTMDPVHLQIAELMEALSTVANSGERVEPVFAGDRLDPENHRVRAALQRPSGVAAGEYTLTALVAELQEQTGVNVRLDVGALEDLGIAVDTNIAIPTGDLTVQDLFAQLDSHAVAYSIRWGTLLVTTSEAAEEDIVSAVFDIRDLVSGDRSASLIAETDPWSVQSLKDVIHHTIDTDIWTSSGGQATIGPIPELQCLVVQAPARTLGKVERLLDGLRTAGGPDGLRTGSGSIPDGYVLRTVHVGANPEPLVATMKQVVAPGTWNESGVVLAIAGPVLVIQHRDEVVARAMRFIASFPRTQGE